MGFEARSAMIYTPVQRREGRASESKSLGEGVVVCALAVKRMSASQGDPLP